MKTEIKSFGENYNPGSMSFVAGFLGPQGKITGGFMTFSINKAKEIAEHLGINKIARIVAGLDGDFTENSCRIYDDKGWHEYTAYEGSDWATPIILITFKSGKQETFESWEK